MRNTRFNSLSLPYSFFFFFVWKMHLNPATPLLHSLLFQGCLLVGSKVLAEEQMPPDIFGQGFQALQGAGLSQL